MLSLGGFLKGLNVKIEQPKQQSSVISKLLSIGITDPKTAKILEQSLTLAKSRDPLVSTVLKAMVTDPDQFEQAFLRQEEPQEEQKDPHQEVKDPLEVLSALTEIYMTPQLIPPDESSI